MEPVTVYIDILFLVNTAVDYFLLLGTATLRRLTFSRFRLLLGAAAGALYSCAVFFPELSLAFTFIGKMAASAGVCLLVFPLRGKRSFFLTFLCFHGLSALFAGLIMGADLLFHPRNILVSNGEMYINISAGLLIAVAAAAYGVLWLCSRLFSFRGGKTGKLSIEADGKTVTLSALLDSGNLLTDPLTGAKVCVTSLSAVSRLLPDTVREAFRKNDLTAVAGDPWRTRVWTVSCSTVTGQGLLPVFRPDRVLLNGRPVDRKTVIAVRQEPFSGDYDALVGIDLPGA